MKKLNIFAVGTVCAMSVSMPLIGSGVAAAADAYAGQTYADASSALKAAGLKGVIASDQCVVTRSEKAPWMHVNGKNFGTVTDTVLLFLNCNAAVASATTPGNSAASPEGRAALAKANSAAAQGQSTAAGNKNKPKL